MSFSDTFDSPYVRIRHFLSCLYGEETATAVEAELIRRLRQFQADRPVPPSSFSAHLSERDTVLITYGDQFREPDRPPMQTLHSFLNDHLRDAIGGVHILPCFPYSSDDGFSVMDYRQVDPALGDWDDVAAIGRDYRLMLDFVANHISRQSAWFQAFLRGKPPYRDYFIVVDPGTDLTAVVRPRTSPLLTPVETPQGTRYVWTTFSSDQMDLNYANPQVLLEMTDVLLHYVAHGARIVRLDAIAYLWKEIGTPCIHLPQTHAVVKFWRAVLDAVAPEVLLITETNVPHAENIRYFGERLAETESTDEAQMVYNFALAPLTLHALQTGDATRLSHWAATLKMPFPKAAFFNVIASHDGIGILPARGILNEMEIQGLVDQTLAHGGRVSYRTTPDGSTGVYELNTTLYDLLNDPSHPDPDRDIARFLASQVILLSLAGVPGIYVHSLFGSRNCHECFVSTGQARSLNRRKFCRAELEKILANPERHEGRVFHEYRRLLRLRREESAFHPAGGQQVLDLGDSIFAVLRTPPGPGRPVLCLVNCSPQAHTLSVDTGLLGPDKGLLDLLTGRIYFPEAHRLNLVINGYQACWLTPCPSPIVADANRTG